MIPRPYIDKMNGFSFKNVRTLFPRPYFDQNNDFPCNNMWILFSRKVTQFYCNYF